MKGRPFTRPHRWRPPYTARDARVIEGEVYQSNGKFEPNFLSRLERHLAWHLLGWFITKHPVIAAQIGFAALTEAARFAVGELGKRFKDRDP